MMDFTVRQIVELLYRHGAYLRIPYSVVVDRYGETYTVTFTVPREPLQRENAFEK